MQRTVDAEVRRIVESAHLEVAALLREHRGRLDALSHALIEHETLDEAAAYAAAGIERADEGQAVPRQAASTESFASGEPVWT